MTTNSILYTACIDEIIKIAKVKEPKTETEKIKELATPLAIGAGAAVGQATLGHHVFPHMLNTVGKDPELAKTLMQQQLSEHPELVRGRLADPNAGAYISEYKGKKVKAIGLGDRAAQSPGVVSHELGHASIARNRLGRLLQNKVTNAMGRFSPHIGVISGGLSGNSDNETVRRIGRLAPVLTSVPQLMYEGGASLAGLKHLHNVGASKGQLARAAATQLAAFGTYALHPAMGYAAARLAQNGVTNARDELAHLRAKGLVE